jgi:hypothetical protein
VKAGTPRSVQQAGDAAVDIRPALGRLRDAGEDFEQRTLARSVAADACPELHRKECRAPRRASPFDLAQGRLQKTRPLAPTANRWPRGCPFCRCAGTGRVARAESVNQRIPQRIVPLLGFANVGYNLLRFSTRMAMLDIETGCG